MKKDTLRFINGEQNVTVDTFMLSREKAGNSELIFVSLPEYDEALFALWNSKNGVKKYRKTKTENGDIVFRKVEPRGTGNKETFVMLMPNALNELRKKELSLEAFGFLLKIIDCIEWNTGRIVRKRDMKPMTIEMLSKYINKGKIKTKSIIKELREKGVLFYLQKEKAYYINYDYMRKGAISNED